MRNAIDDLGMKTRIRVQRYLCKRKKRTYSMLPEELIPYRASSLGFLAVFWRMLLFIDQSHKQILSAIVDRFPESSAALNMDYSHLNDVEGILQLAMNRVTALTGTGFPSIQCFFEFCSAYVFNGRTGWLAVTQWFYEQQHRFLFGTASQHR